MLGEPTGRDSDRANAQKSRANKLAALARLRKQIDAAFSEAEKILA